MRTVRIGFWLLLLPGALLYLAWKITTLVDTLSTKAPPPGVAAEPARVTPEEATPADAVPDDAAPERAVRRALAQRCVDLALRAAAPRLREADPLLVLVAGAGCGEGCDLDARATALVDAWYARGLQVLLLRTREGGPAATPAGVTTLVLPQCAALAQAPGDDYFLRYRDGSLGSDGERHARWRQQSPDDETPAFDPEGLVAAHYRLP
jgi:hypothetical protein